MSTLNVNNINEAGGVDAVITAGVLDSGSLPAGSILQVVQASDNTDRSTTSGSPVDANISVSITPTSASSKIWIIWFSNWTVTSTSAGFRGHLYLTDSSNTELNGGRAETRIGAVNNGFNGDGGFNGAATLIAFEDAGSTSARTYKARFARVDSGATVFLANDRHQGQMYAIEVAA